MSTHLRSFLLLCVLVLAQLSARAQLQKVVTYHDKEKTAIREKYSVQPPDTLPQGKYQRFYRSGKLEALARFDRGKQDSIYTEYYENGQVRVHIPYVAGKRQGTFKTFYPNGKVLQEGSYENDQQSQAIKT
jgi:antitoxin component YwqK of YwqJK toxin-antitoxin module